MLTLKDYFKGRDKQFPTAFNAQIEANARETLDRVNALLALFYAANPKAASRSINSGWRPPAVNRRIKTAAKRSHHLTAKACDLSDDDGALDRWLMTKPGQAALEKVGLWMEHPDATPRWCHVQIVPPKSGKRVFHP